MRENYKTFIQFAYLNSITFLEHLDIFKTLDVWHREGKLAFFYVPQAR